MGSSVQKHKLSNGVFWWPGYLNLAAQQALLADLRQVVAQAPLYTPTMPRTGKPLSVRMTNCGSLGWVTDKDQGYRYQSNHPVTGNPWPDIPAVLLDAWQELTGLNYEPEVCLVNFYDANAKMGLHQDKDEVNLEAPVLSLSLGDTCQFRLGGLIRKDKTQIIKLASGDALILSGQSRLAFHGVDKIFAGSSTLLKQNGRINVTMRRVSET